MLVIKKICDYTIPIFGNKRVLPYAKLLVSDGITEFFPMNGTPDWIARVEPLRFEYKEVAV